MPSESSLASPGFLFRRILLGLIIAVQLLAIGGAVFSPSFRYLAWAPFHEPATYRIWVTVDGQELSDDVVSRRYGFPRIHHKSGSPEDWQLNDIRNVLDVVEAYESSVGRRDRAEVRIEIHRSERSPEVWRWPAAP